MHHIPNESACAIWRIDGRGRAKCQVLDGIQHLATSTTPPMTRSASLGSAAVDFEETLDGVIDESPDESRLFASSSLCDNL